VETPVAEGILRTVRTVATVVMSVTQGSQNRDSSHSRKSRDIDSGKNNSKRSAKSSTRDNWNIQDANLWKHHLQKGVTHSRDASNVGMPTKAGTPKRRGTLYKEPPLLVSSSSSRCTGDSNSCTLDLEISALANLAS
jgi:hypothetical protein